ncbi:hypothetical protein RN346_05350 [Halomonas sp. PAMB 3232]|uniref:hypothetical protein n=1 Tax=Halomonas sp. PAMB 3232 TaxID=3075221 RepID=UPI00289D07C6|nr:hypothetical protein [Halomonas sp. PAMB 3232]WNL39990.1 hypothetical protein RN346_05350 [Halomonas sp. PAMB 3232]
MGKESVVGERAMTPNERFHARQVALYKRMGLHVTAIVGAVFGLMGIALLVLTVGLLIRFQIVGVLIAAATTGLLGYIARGMIREGTKRRLKTADRVTMIKGVMEQQAVSYATYNGRTTLYFHSIGDFEFIRPLDTEYTFMPFVGKPFVAHVVELSFETFDGTPLALKKKREAILLKLESDEENEIKVDIDGVYTRYGRSYFYRYFLAHALIIGPSILLSLVLMIRYSVPLADAYGLGLFTGLLAIFVPIAIAFAIGSLVYFLCQKLRKLIDPDYVKTHEERLKG